MLRTIKNILYSLSGSLLRLVLFFGITATVILIVLGNSKTLKTTLSTSNAYNRFVPSLIEANKKAANQDSSISFNDPKIAEIFTTSFPASDLKLNTEKVIDNTYAWLNKESPTFAFKIDFTNNKQLFAQKLTDYTFDRFEQLPFCKQDPTEVDPLTASCMPKNIDIEGSKKSYQEQIFLSDSFLNKTVLTQNDLPKNSNGQSIAEQFSFLPTLFTWLKRSPFIVGALLLLLAADYILLSPRKRKGIQSLATILISSGVSILVFPLIYNYVVPYYSKSFQFSFKTTGTEKLFSDIIDQLSRNVDFLFISMGASVAVLGFVIYISERLTRPQTKYHNLEKKAGLAVGIKKQGEPPKSLRGKLSPANVPLQTSDAVRTKKVKPNSKYRTLYKKKEL